MMTLPCSYRMSAAPVPLTVSRAACARAAPGRPAEWPSCRTAGDRPPCGPGCSTGTLLFIRDTPSQYTQPATDRLVVPPARQVLPCSSEILRVSIHSRRPTALWSRLLDRYSPVHQRYSESVYTVETEQPEWHPLCPRNTGHFTNRHKCTRSDDRDSHNS